MQSDTQHIDYATVGASPSRRLGAYGRLIALTLLIALCAPATTLALSGPSSSGSASVSQYAPAGNCPAGSGLAPSGHGCVGPFVDNVTAAQVTAQATSGGKLAFTGYAALAVSVAGLALLGLGLGVRLWVRPRPIARTHAP